MRKILAVYDGLKYSGSTTQYAAELAKVGNGFIVGAFLHDLRYLNLAQYYTFDQPFIDLSGLEKIRKEDDEKINLNVALFRRYCEERGIHHKVHLDRGVPLQEVLRESAFADFIIIDSHTGFSSVGENQPSAFLKDLLADSYCPVLLVPHKYSYFDKIVFCYDGSPSSVHAFKMFSYIFPGFREMDAIVVSVNENGSNHLADGKNFKELAMLHFKNISYEILQGDTTVTLINYLKQNALTGIVVMGAYSRSTLSRLFYQSMADRVLKEMNVPLFITHL
ncbi:MAG: universal stress protein [Chitinophagales bacterium]|nr:universal stress protein [Chitinophagales bacterium]MDW8418937.1 universal stress protein [Chitinophagales bacterium]